MTFTFSHDHVGITVTREDLDATIAWYSRTLAFTVDQRFESHGTTFVFLTAGDVRIELRGRVEPRRGTARQRPHQHGPLATAPLLPRGHRSRRDSVPAA